MWLCEEYRKVYLIVCRSLGRSEDEDSIPLEAS